MSISARTYSNELADCSKRTVTEQLPTLHAVREAHTLKKVKQSRKRPGVAQMVPGGLGSQIS